MGKTDDVVAVLGEVLSDKSFIASLMQGENLYDSGKIEQRLGTVIKYYIATRDSHMGYTYEEIESKYSKIKDSKLEPDTELYKNTVTHGFFTHSFNGYKKDRIMQYGLNYMGNIKDEGTLAEVQGSRAMLQELESILGKSEFVHDKHLPNEVFLSSPGNKTAYYACKNAPERLYLGPLKGYEKEPMVVGETKQTYMLRVLTKKIQQKYPDTTSPEYMEALKLAKGVTEYFCSKPPAVAFLSTDQMKDMPVSTKIYEPDKSQSLEEHLKGWIEMGTKPHFYTIKGDKGLQQVKGYRLKETGEEVKPIITKRGFSFDDYDQEEQEDEVVTGYRLIGTGKEVSPEEVEPYTRSYQRQVAATSLKPKIIGYRLKETGEDAEPIITEEYDEFGYDYKEVITGYRLIKTGKEVSEEEVEAIKDGYYIEISEEERLELAEDEIEPIYSELPLDHMFSFIQGDRRRRLRKFSNIGTIYTRWSNGWSY